MLLREARAQRATLERLVSELTDDPDTRQNVIETLAQVSGIETLLATDRESKLDLPALMRFLNAQATIAVAAATAGKASASHTSAAELAAASSASRQQVRSLMRDMHRFDPYLRFVSPEEEADYRRREAERRNYIEEQQARGTPEGNLNAAGAAVSQMADAGAHGAANSPEFRQRFDELTDTTRRLRDEVRRSGRSTREFDDRMREDLRRTLRARGVPDVEIEARFAAHPDPLEAVTAYVRSVDDIGAIQQSANDAARRSSTIVAADAPAQSQTVSEAIARLRAAGVTAAADHPHGQDYAHGVSANEGPAISAGQSAPG